MSGRLRTAFWPDVKTRAGAEKSIRRAAGFAYVVAAVSTVGALLAWFNVAQIVSRWSIVIAVVFAVLGYFIRRGSGVAAVLGLILYVAGFVINVAAAGSSAPVAFGLIITLAFLNGVRGTVGLRRLGPAPQTMREALAERDRSAFEAIEALHQSRQGRR
jgi:hypothetical protein